MPQNIERHYCIFQVRRSSLTPSRFVLLCGMAAVISSAASCGHGSKWDLIPVEGTVSQAGHPLVGVEVVFVTDLETGARGPRTSGLTDAAGRFALYTDGGGRGAAVGRYRVCLVAPPDEKALQQLGARLQEDMKKRLNEEKAKSSEKNSVRVPQKFRLFEKTPLRAEVKAGGKQIFDFVVPEVNVENRGGGP